MNTKTIAGVIVSAVVMVMLFAAVIVPVVSNATTTEDTFKNEGYFNLTKYTAEDSVTMSWDAATPDVFTVNGNDVTYHNDNTFAVSVALGEMFAVRLPTNNTAINFYGAGTYVNTNTTSPTFTLTYTEGSLTATNGTNTKTIANVSEIYVITNDGEYTMKKTDAPSYLNSGSEIIADSEIYASGQTFNGGNYIFWHLDGTINDMNYPDTFDSNLTITNEQINGRYANSYNDLYVLDNLKFTATTSNSVVYNVTASYFVVPAEVTAERAGHLDSAEITLLNTVPIIITIAIIMVIMGLIFSRRE